MKLKVICQTLVIAAVAVGLSSCTMTRAEKGAATGALVGAAVGGLAGGNTGSVAIGAAAGAVGGAAIAEGTR